MLLIRTSNMLPFIGVERFDTRICQLSALGSSKTERCTFEVSILVNVDRHGFSSCTTFRHREEVSLILLAFEGTTFRNFKPELDCIAISWINST